MATGPRLGFNPARNIGSGPDNKGLTEYPLLSTYGVALGAGDVVKLGTNGTVEVATNGADVLGIFHGCFYVDITKRIQYQKYWPASQVSYDTVPPTALIMDQPAALFNVLADGPIPLCKIGDIYAVNLTAPNANIGHSNMTIATTAFRAGTLAVTGVNNAALAGLANTDAFTVKSSVANILGTITIATSQTPAQLLALINGVPGIAGSLDASNFLHVTATDGGNLILADSTGTPLSDSNLLGPAGTYVGTAMPLPFITGTLAVTGVNNAGLSNLANTDAFTIKSSVANAPGTITISTSQTPSQLLTAINAVAGIYASYDASNFLNVATTDGGSLVLVDGNGTPLADSGLLAAAGVYTRPTTASAGMVRVTKVVDVATRCLEVELVNHLYRHNGI